MESYLIRHFGYVKYNIRKIVLDTVTVVWYLLAIVGKVRLKQPVLVSGDMEKAAFGDGRPPLFFGRSHRRVLWTGPEFRP